MRLFDDKVRIDDAVSYSQPLFDLLNNSGSPEIDRIRHYLEGWFGRYPSLHKPDLRGRFRSAIDSQHNSAFFELLLHELLLCLGCDVEVHPAVEGIPRSPDFHVIAPDGGAFYLEATTVTYESDSKAAGQSRLNDLYDVLNRHVDSTDFFLHVEIESAPESPPPAREIARVVNEYLRGLDPDEIALLYERDDFSGVPKWRFNHQGWLVRFSPIPKKPEARGKPGIRPLGMLSTGWRFVDHRTPLRDSIADKATAYGNLGVPYLVAVNVLEMVDEADVLEALFGKERCRMYFARDSLGEVQRVEYNRIPDGVWTSFSGATNTRLSGVIIAHGVHPWNLSEARLRLYHNPWAEARYTSVLTQLPQAIPMKDSYDYGDGRSLFSILGLD
jgi:hypothetical protein